MVFVEDCENGFSYFIMKLQEPEGIPGAAHLEEERSRGAVLLSSSPSMLQVKRLDFWSQTSQHFSTRERRAER